MKKLNDPLAWIGKEEEQSTVVDIDIDKIIVRNAQVRTKENILEGIEELAESIKQIGVNQSLLVTKQHNLYLLIAGERRLEASKIAGLTTVPCLVKDIKEEDIWLYQLIENIHRKDLTPIELANVYGQLKNKGLSIREIAEKINKSKSHVQEILSISNMPEELKEKVSGGGTLSKIIAAQQIIDEEKKKEIIDNIDNYSRDEIRKIKSGDDKSALNFTDEKIKQFEEQEKLDKEINRNMKAKKEEMLKNYYTDEEESLIAKFNNIHDKSFKLSLESIKEYNVIFTPELVLKIQAKKRGNLQGIVNILNKAFKA